MTTVLITEPVPPAVVAGMQALLPEGATCEAVLSMSEEEFAARIAKADVLLVIHREIDAATFAMAPHLRFVQRCGVGYDNIDILAAAAAGVSVAYTPGANAAAVAEHTILLMLALLKQFPAAEQATRSGTWWTPGETVGRGLGDLVGTQIGLVGLGNIGRAVTTRLAPFGARVVYTARHQLDASIEAQLETTYNALPDLLATSNIVSLHIPLTKESRGLIGEAEIALMPPGSYLINTSRGEIVDEAALRRAIISGHLAGAALDVLQHEGPGGNPFTDLPQVIVTPHMAGATRGSGARIIQMAAANVARFLSGETPLNVVPAPP